jgi:flagellar hook assembly protein FlgD
MSLITPASVPYTPAPVLPKDQATENADGNKEMFLKLLVAQLQNQNPASPSDPMEFVSQLTQFSTLEQTIAMRQELASIHAALTASTTA